MLNSFDATGSISLHPPKKYINRTVPFFPIVSSMRLQYHSSPVKQRAVRNKKKEGAPHQGRFPPLQMKNEPQNCGFFIKN